MSNLWGRLFDRHQHDVGTASSTEVGEGQLPVHWLDVTPRTSDDKPCAIKRLELQARVTGLHAEVIQTLEISNPNRRPISVPVAIPMPDGAVVCGYALEVDGQMIDGVVVEQEKARVAFETEQRRGADPGLVEAVRGNLYRTRVYPVPARGSRSLRLRYVTPLSFEGTDAAYLDLPLPAEVPETCGVSIDVEQLAGETSRPIVSGIDGVSLSEQQGGWSLHHEATHVTAQGPLRVTLPVLPGRFVLTERDAKGDVWFVASEKLPAETPTETAPDLTDLTLLWDASGSRAGIDHQREIELVRSCGSTESVKTLRLVVFADRVREVREFSDVDELARHLADLSYDGATNLAELSRTLGSLPQACAGVADGSACLLFSDGLDTLSDEPFVLPEGCDALAVVSGTERDVEALRQACHGLAFTLAHAPRNARELVLAFDAANPQRLLDVRGTGIADVCDAGLMGSGRRCVIGRLVEDEVNLAFGGTGTPFPLVGSAARPGNVLAAAWAARRVALLSVRASENANELLTLGRRFGVVSPTTSLLVLEELDQWLRYDIEPPASWERMHEAWLRTRAGRMSLSSPQSERDDHRWRLAREWKATLSWWERSKEAAERTALAELDVITCPSCASPSPRGMRFCPRCGARLPRWAADIETSASLYDQFGEGFPDSAPMPCSAPAPERASESESAPAPRSMRGGSRPRPRLCISDAEDDEPRARSYASSPARREAAVPLAAMDGAWSEDDDLADYAVGSDSLEAEGPVAGSSERSAAPAPSVRVRPWMPDALYLKALDEAFAEGGIDAARAIYFGQRAQYRTTPSFFLDCAGWFMAHDDQDFGLTVLTNLAELRIDDPALLRVMGWRMRETGRLVQALLALRRVLHMRREDSQSHRDVAIVLDELARMAFAEGDEDAARAYATEAGELYRHIALTPWERRPMAIGLFAVEEYNVLRAWADAQSWEHAPELPSLGEDLEGVLDCDLRITLAWDADETDVDIHVTEPSGEEAYYGHRNTSSGGRVSEDITDGFGPELYETRQAQDGVYRIRAHYYASHQQTIFGPATCTLTVYTDWGRPTQAQRVTTTRLDNQKEMVPVGMAAYGAAAQQDGEAEPGENPEVDPSRITRGMPVDEVIALLGEPDTRESWADGEQWVFTQPGNRQLAVCLAEGVVERVVERMPWGDTMIISQ